MRLALDYRPAPDRLQLSWQDAVGAHCLWLTRRHALALLAALDAAAGGEGTEPASEARGGGTPQGVPDDPAAVDSASGPLPAPAGGVTLRDALVLGLRLREGRLALRTADGTVKVSLPAGAATRLRGSLRDVCERAGWDVAAGMGRLRSARLAREAIERARGA